MNLVTLLSEQRHEQITLGMSGAAVYRLPDLGAYLKITKLGGFSDLAHERDVLEWLCGKMPVPAVLGYDTTDGCEYLLTSAINGIPSSDHLSAGCSTPDTERALAAKAARTLRRMHDLSIAGCVLDQQLDSKFVRARKNIERKLLTETDEEFAIEHDGKFPFEVLHELSANRVDEDDLVFTHGDPCMPNIMVDNDEIVGFIDLDGAGIADRYCDIAIFFRSFYRNARVPVELEATFCDAYGIEKLDVVKLDFYSLLDDLF